MDRYGEIQVALDICEYTDRVLHLCKNVYVQHNILSLYSDDQNGLAVTITGEEAVML